MYLRQLQLRRTASKFAGGRLISKSVFEDGGEDGTGGEGGSGGEGGEGGEGGTGGGKGGSDGTGGTTVKTFTQEQVIKQKLIR